MTCLSDGGRTAKSVSCVTKTNQDAGLRDVHVVVRPPTVVIVCGVVGMPGSAFSVEFDESRCVGFLKQAIRDEHKYPFPGSALRLFLAKKDDGNWVTVADIENGAGDADTKHLKELDIVESPISSVGLSVEDVGPKAGSGDVNVLVKLPTSSSIRVENSAQRPLYNGVAGRLKASAEVQNLVATIKTMQKGSEGCDALTMPFVVLENSSGTGKTQKTFNLQATGECDVFYMVCVSLGDVHQDIYGGFIRRSGGFRSCIRQDAKTLGEGSVADFIASPRLFIYSFVIAALHGLDVASGLEATREDVERARDYRRRKTDKPFVFFLDEFLRVGNYEGEEKEARMKQEKEARMKQ
ncbi:hypothetical protein PHYSODRAFT_478488 [Phytophthora sojae]|uniref:Crinkler effector protein N-terminal domain-containing protein n=1 Tax=Phytophthora sojae (strain P6497) TaxID=1094619 RepID=G4YRK9_PHYSP|nr:hypothetical protein PHYSODRAFT_478488 [Phytophthora sojae]EGZ23474.1 hypothetical protein PHYSODRAFT_478488 [Phytophthora sojae]|eukprot:XP_009518762.1 hypothetical protein PHYSODRAFT_478488 [Phytophthora sojae]